MKLDYIQLMEIISGRRTGLFAAIVRLLLFGISVVYRFPIQIRNWAYDTGWKTVHRIDVRVISIGNLTTGGTGKTPFVIWLANELKNRMDVAVLSRGYGSVRGELNDEGRELKLRMPDVAQIQNPDRVSAAQELLSTLSHRLPQTQPIIILDDGFQHRRLARDLDIVLVDATCPFGFDALLPRGLLREPVVSIKRCDLAILTRSNFVSRTVRNEIRNRLMTANPNLLWAEGELGAGGWLSPDHTKYALDFLNQRKVLAFCGIGNPAGFVQTLRKENIHVVDAIFFNDHYDYSSADLSRVIDQAKNNQCDAIVCTVKDLVKLDFEIPAGLPVYALLTEFRIKSGADVVQAALQNILPELEDSRRNESAKTLSHR